jgi:glycosyltransferase involved in cell wall biosynthesis
VPPKNADALAAAMLDLMQEPAEFRQTLGQSAHARISSHFSIETRTDEWEALYQVIVETQH